MRRTQRLILNNCKFWDETIWERYITWEGDIYSSIIKSKTSASDNLSSRNQWGLNYAIKRYLTLQNSEKSRSSRPLSWKKALEEHLSFQMNSDKWTSLRDWRMQTWITSNDKKTAKFPWRHNTNTYRNKTDSPSKSEDTHDNAANVNESQQKTQLMVLLMGHYQNKRKMLKILLEMKHLH